MAKLSQLDKAIASMKADRDHEWHAAVLKNAMFNSLIDTLKAQRTPPAKKPSVVRKVRKLGSVMDDRPAS